jgi:hypothetical protein
MFQQDRFKFQYFLEYTTAEPTLKNKTGRILFYVGSFILQLST